MALTYRREIDGLRAVAVLPVILFHAGVSVFSGGYVGVDVFFVISGYLITTILARELEEGRFSLLNFYERRARRILPALFFVLAVTTIAAIALMLPYELESFGQGLMAVIFFASNILFWSQSGYFAPDAELNPLLHTWSLAVEEQYYILAPLLLWGMWRMGLGLVCYALALLAAVSLALAHTIALSYPSANFYLLPSRAWELLAGSLTALYLLRRAPPSGVLADLLSIAGLGAIGVSIVAFNDATPFPSLWTLLPVSGSVAIILGANPGTLVGKVLGTGPLVGVGLISYSAYLWHQPLFAFARLLAPENHPPLAIMLCLSAVSLGLAWLTWRFMERPFRQKNRFTGLRIFSLSAAGGLCIALLGFLLVQTGGLLNRYPAQEQRWIAKGQLYYSPYVWSNYVDVFEAPLSTSKPNMVLVGDSFSQDFYNGIHETGAFPDHAISAIWVPAKCQIRYAMPPEAIEKNTAAKDRAECDDTELNAEDLALMRQAEIVIFVSNWRPWAAEHLGSSIAAMNLPGQVLVVGSKHFERNRRVVLKAGRQFGTAARASPSDKARSSTEILAQTLPAEVFVNFLDILCQTDCPIFTPAGDLIAYDGIHLTPEGAAYVGQELFKTGPLKPFAPH